MIVTKLKDLGKYKSLIQNYKEIQNFDFKNAKAGVTKLKDDNYLVIMSRKLADNNIYESHKKYIDIHMPLSSSEVIKYIDERDYQIVKPYDEKEDVSLGFTNVKATKIRLNVGEVAIFLPGDPHMPWLKASDEKEIHLKSVIKVKFNG